MHRFNFNEELPRGRKKVPDYIRKAISLICRNWSFLERTKEITFNILILFIQLLFWVWHWDWKKTTALVLLPSGRDREKQRNGVADAPKERTRKWAVRLEGWIETGLQRFWIWLCKWYRATTQEWASDLVSEGPWCDPCGEWVVDGDIKGRISIPHKNQSETLIPPFVLIHFLLSSTHTHNLEMI